MLRKIGQRQIEVIVPIKVAGNHGVAVPAGVHSPRRLKSTVPIPLKNGEHSDRIRRDYVDVAISIEICGNQALSAPDRITSRNAAIPKPTRRSRLPLPPPPSTILPRAGSNIVIGILPERF
jgi:hypothetical protein